MKKSAILLLIVPVILFFASACRKEKNGITVTKVIYVSINANETYTTEVSRAGDADDILQITGQPAHALVSKLTSTSSGNALFQYTPAVDYTGTDEVLISSEEGGHGHGGNPGHGNCGNGHHHDDGVIYDYKITIQGTAHRSGS